MTISARELKRRVDLDGRQATERHLESAIRQRHLQPNDFSLRELAEVLIPNGRDWLQLVEPRSGGAIPLAETADGIDVSSFLNITGQIVQTAILQGYQQESFVATKLVETIPTRLDGEKIAGVTRVGETLREVGPGMPYPNAGFEEDYIETPSTEKHGLIIPITREALYFDRTHLILRRAREVGEVLGLAKEKRILDCVLGLTNTYTWRGTSYDTYQAAAPPWRNLLASNELVDWQNVDAIEQMFAEAVDPRTGDPVLLHGTDVLVMPAYRHQAHRIFNASTVEHTTGDTAVSTANPLGHYQVFESRLAYRRLLDAGVATADARKVWLMGDFAKAFAYMENWPITVTQSAAGSEADFNQDLVLRFKASERGTPAVLDPRYVVKSTG